MYLSETLKQANCQYIGKHDSGGIVVYNAESGAFEHYRHNPHFAGYTLRYKGRKYEFIANCAAPVF